MAVLQIVTFACVALLQFLRIAASPVLYAGQLTPPPTPTECRIEMMDKVEHKTFYDYCSSFEGSEVNVPRDSVYFASKTETYKNAEKAVLQILNPSDVPISQECMVYLQPFVCFNFFKFPLSDDCAEGYLPPCTDLCELTHQVCMKDLESLVERGVVNDTTHLQHLECTNFPENNVCVRPDDKSMSAETEAPTTEEATEVSPTDVPVECNCAKKVRQNVTRRMIMDPSYSLAARISVQAIREEGEGADKHVVYDVTVLKEYQISCRDPIQDGEVTTIHMETPMQCLEGDYGCRAMAVGRDHEYLVVGTTTEDGHWLLKDSKGSGGCAISKWIPKYEKMDKWAAKSLPSDCTNELQVTE